MKFFAKRVRDLSLAPLAKKRYQRTLASTLAYPSENEFSTTRTEMFEMVKRNEAVFVLCNADNMWYIIDKNRYAKNVEINSIQEHFPLELCFKSHINALN